MGEHMQGAETWIDALATPFDRAWMAGQRPRIEDWLAQVEGARRPPLLEELLRVELEYRQAAGEVPALEDYDGRFAEYPGVVRAAFAGPETGPYPAGTTAATMSPGPPATTSTPTRDGSEDEGFFRP